MTLKNRPSSAAQRTRRIAAPALLVAFALACGGSDPVAPPPGTGSLRLTTTTAGDYPDLDGYTYSIDGSTEQALPLNGSITLNGVSAGTHSLVIGGVDANCTVGGGKSRNVAVSKDAVADVTLTVTCTTPAATHPAGNVVGVQSIFGQPYGVAVSPSGVVYVALIGTSELIKGDLATMSFTSEVTVGATPPHVAMNPAGTRAYATLQYGQGLAIVDVATNTLLNTLSFTSDGFNLIVSPDGARVYATTAGGTLYVVDAASQSVVTTLNVGPAANGLAFSPDGHTLYVSSRDGGTVTAVNTQTNGVIRTYTVGGMPQRVAVSRDGSEIYVANEINGLDIIKASTGDVSHFGFGTPGYGLGITPDGTQLYVLLAQAGQVVVLNRADRSIVKTIIVGGHPRNVAFDVPGRTALVTNEQSVIFIK